MKKVLLIVGTSLVNAGVPNVVMKMVQCLHGEYSFDIILGDTEEGFYDREFLSYGGEIIRYKKIQYEDGIFRFLQSGKQLYNIVVSVLKKKKYDIVHCHNGYLSGWALHAAYNQKVPVRISHSHGTYLIKGKNIPVNLFKIYSMKKINKYSTHRLACSDIAGKTLFLGKSFENILNPVDVESFCFPKQIHKGINLLQIGYYCPLKNQMHSIAVLKELRQRGKDVKLSFIGFETNKSYVKKMHSFILENQLKEYVSFYPSDYPKECIFPTCDFFLLPSTSEGLPLVTLEAQSSNIYTIVSDVVSKDIDMGLCCFLPNNDVKLWADTIIEKYGYKQKSDPEKLKKIDIGSFMKRIVEIYR